jgi:uncharacterized protein (DUF952 family)
VEPLVHLVGRAEWDAAIVAGGPYRPPGADRDGFVHLSSPAQVLVPAERLLPGRDDLVVVVLDPRRLRGEVRWEEGVPPEPGMLFPHLYGDVDLDAVMAVVPLRRGADGRYVAPELPALD